MLHEVGKIICAGIDMLRSYLELILNSLSTSDYSLSKLAISMAISSTVKLAVFLATLSANEGLKLITSCLEILCQIGSNICSPVIVRVTIPSNS